MKYFLTTIFAAFLAIAASAQRAEATGTTEVREFLSNGRSTIVFTAPDNELRNSFGDIFSSIERDYTFIDAVEINPETKNIEIICTKDIGLVEVAEIMKEFNISRYHYSWEVETAGI